jgi:tRNA(Leu) C34 or U34 (ribose-2'-O)-methylase TrmL
MYQRSRQQVLEQVATAVPHLLHHPMIIRVPMESQRRTMVVTAVVAAAVVEAMAVWLHNNRVEVVQCEADEGKCMR